MFRWRWLLIPTIGLSLVCGIQSALAQTDSKSHGDRELSRIRNQDTRSDSTQDYSIDRTVRNVLNRAQIQGVGGVTQSSLPRRSYSDLGLSPSSAGKPFAGVTPSPTVSPYLNLFREDLSGNDDLNYQTLVRPQLEQQRVNAQVQRQNMELSRRVQSLSARSDYNPQGNQNQYPTGHPTVFNYHGRYYPSARRR
jgi:hypothetical protein